MKKRKMKISWRKVLSFALAILLLCGVVAGVSALVEHFDDDMKTIHPTFKIGALDVEGVATSDKGALYTPEAFKADGLEVNLDPESHLSYRVFYYTADNEYLGCSELFTKSSKPYFGPGVFARVVLYPIWDQLDDGDEKISWYQIWSYTSDVELRVLKDGYKYEKVLLSDDFFKMVSGTVEDGGYSFKQFTIADTETDVIDSFYLGTASGTMQELPEMAVRVLVDGKSYCFDNADIPTLSSRVEDLPTKDNPVYISTGVVWAIDVYSATTDYNDLVVYVHRAPKE